MFDVDVVITYVDNTDAIWQQKIKQYNTTIDEKRFRSWDNLKYLFRGIETNMKFVKNVYLVVSNIEQVPSFVNRDKVRVVLHEDIIPEKYLPTFNSTTIEMFLCKIPDLAEHFIYFNDDMFPMKELDVGDFFDKETGYPKYQLIERTHAHNSFRMQCRNSYRLACKAFGKEVDDKYYSYIKHSADPMLKSDSLELWERCSDKILWSLSKFREPFNFTQYLFPDYSIIKGHWKESSFDFRYYKTNELDEIEYELKNNVHKMICLNDSNAVKDEDDCVENENRVTFEESKDRILKLFDQKYKERSSFEI